MALSLGGRIVNGGIVLSTIRFPAPVTASPLHRALHASPCFARVVRVAFDRLPESIIRPFAAGFITSVLQPSSAIYRAGAILVNREGRRFGDETGDLTAALTAQPEGVAFILFDGRIAQRFSRWPHFVSTAPGVGYAYVQDYRRHRPDLWHRANTLALLAQRIGVPAAALQQTADEFNARVAAGERLGLLTPPYCALGPVKAVIVFTDGGLAVDLNLGVMGPDGNAIPGLFAAGSVGQGGLILDGHGHHLGWAFTSGRIAGRNARAAALRRQGAAAGETPVTAQPRCATAA
jgi:succinate dehydrogenase/fumarate reductase flavoprotein subunit